MSKTRLEKVISRTRVSNQQNFHFFLWTAFPFIGCLVTLILATQYSVSKLEIGICIVMWIITGGLGISIGYHRYFTHRAFKATSWLKILMAITGSMAAQGPLIYWVSIHRRHHEQSDKSGDPHSPITLRSDGKSKMVAFWHGHMGWVRKHDVPIPSYYAKDLLKDSSILFVNRNYFIWMTIGLLIPGLIIGIIEYSWLGFLQGVLWGGFVRIFIGNQIIWSINSICHYFGTQDYDTGDSSRNNLWLSIPAFGEGWHNNHHAFPNSANFGLKKWQLDIGYLAIIIMEKLGWIQNVKTASVKTK